MKTPARSRDATRRVTHEHTDTFPRIPVRLPDPSTIPDAAQLSPEGMPNFVSDEQIARQAHLRIAELGETVTGRLVIKVQKGNDVYPWRGAVAVPETSHRQRSATYSPGSSHSRPDRSCSSANECPSFVTKNSTSQLDGTNFRGGDAINRLRFGVLCHEHLQGSGTEKCRGVR